MIDLQEVQAQLGEVLDPELDQSVATLGFIEQVEIQGAEVIIRFRLPTFWCAANFAYIMAADLRERAARVPGVERVTVLLHDHYAQDEISAGVNGGQGFAEIFAGEADGDVDDLRHTFARKAFLVRQEQLLRALLRAGCTVERLAQMTLADVRVEGDALLVRRATTSTTCDEWMRLAGLARTFTLWRQKRLAVGLGVSTSGPIFTTVEGTPLAPQEVMEHLRAARMVRLNGAFNTMLCTGLNRARHGVEIADVAALPDTLSSPLEGGCL